MNEYFFIYFMVLNLELSEQVPNSYLTNNYINGKINNEILKCLCLG